MPLLKLPEPAIAERRYYVRIEEPRALTMEHDTESIGTDNLDHAMGQALQLIFRRDTQFESWLEQHSEPTPKGNPVEGHLHAHRLGGWCTVIQRAVASKASSPTFSPVPPESLSTFVGHFWSSAAIASLLKTNS